MGNKKLFLIAGILSIVTALAFYLFLNQVETAASKIKYVQVVQARDTIPAKTLITGEMLELARIPQEYMHSKALTKQKYVEGKISKVEITAGEQVLSTKLAGSKDTGSGLSFMVPQGKRAVSVPVNDVTGVSGLLRTGDIVDVLGTIDLEDTNRKASVTHLMLENIQILAIGQSLDTGDGKDKDKKDKTSQTQTQSITLAVPGDQVPRLILMTEKGTITLSLRTPVDKNELKRPPVEKGVFWPK